MSKHWWVLLMGLLASCSGWAASFDCKKASTDVEKLICADTELSGLDEELAQAYRAAGKRTAEPERFKREQRTWLKERGECLKGDNPLACLTAMYSERVQALSGDCWRHESWYTGMGSAKYITSGENEPICRLMLENLNRFCHVPPESYVANPSIDSRITTLMTVEWKSVPFTADHLDWLAEKARWNAYPYQKQPDEHRWELLRPVIVRRMKAGELRLWEAKFDLTNDGVADLVRYADYGSAIAVPDSGRTEHFGRGTGLVITDEQTGLPDRRARYGGTVVLNAGTTYLLKVWPATEARLTRPSTNPHYIRFGVKGPPETWTFGEKTVCEFRRKAD